MFIVLKDILTHFKYFLIFTIAATVIFMFIVLSSNIQLIASIIFYPSVSVFEKLGIIIGLIGSIQTNFSTFSVISIITVSVLFGLNVSAVWYLVREFGGVLYDKSIIGSGGGVLTAILGGGCASCGTLVVTPLLSLVGLGGVVAVLPLKGQEFNILAISFLILSSFFILKKVKKKTLNL